MNRADGKWLAIVNPVAGNGMGARIIATLARTFAGAGLRIDVERSPGPGEAARLASAAADEGYAVVVAVGGDGTANEVANGLLDTQTRLALYPIGTGNDLARNLGYPRRRRDVVGFLTMARPHDIDVGLANGRAFLNHVGIGIDGVVAEKARVYARRLGPLLGYAASSVSAIVQYRPVPMRVTLDGEARAGKYLVIVACNGTYFGGGMKAAPQAEQDDGMLDVSLAGDLDKRGAVGALLRLYRGTHVNGTTVLGARVRTMNVELDAPVPMEMDGEPSRAKTLEVTVRQRAMSVLT